MNEESFTSSGAATAAAYPGAPHDGDSPLREKAGHVAQSAQEQAQRFSEAARQQGQDTINQVRSGVEAATAQAQQAGRTFIRNQQESLAQRCSEYAEAARAASEKLRADEGNMLAGPAQQAADRLERVSDYLRNHEPADLLDDVENFARRRPEIVLGGLFVLGLAASRFLKASKRNVTGYQGSGRYQPERARSFRDVDYGTGAGFEEGYTSGTGMGGGSSLSGAVPGSASATAVASQSGSAGPISSAVPASTGLIETDQTSPLWTGGTGATGSTSNLGSSGSSSSSPGTTAYGQPLPKTSSENMP